LGRRISLIWCEDSKGGIGRVEGRGMPWFIKEEMAHFKKTTMFKPCVMGAKTFGELSEPLKGRINVVVTRNPERYVEDVMWLDSPRTVIREINAGEIMICGGRTMYEFFEPFADRLYRSVLNKSYRCDVQMPDIDYSNYYCVGVDTRKDFTIEVYNRMGST
jgi:dihydrofolate reductase